MKKNSLRDLSLSRSDKESRHCERDSAKQSSSFFVLSGLLRLAKSASLAMTCSFTLFITSTYAANLTNISSSNAPTSARVVFSLTEKTPYHVFTLANPDRVVVDFENTHLKYDLTQLQVTQIKSVRSGAPVPTKLRIVFDFNSKPKINSFYDEKNQQLKMDLFFSTPIVQEEKKSRPIVVVIDAGHGGKDSGAVGENGTKEKDVVLAISKKLANLIDDEPGMKAVMTRKGDYFVPLRNRINLARKGKADLFVAVHADSYFNSRASGASVYALSRRGATSEAARWLAKKENYSELGGVDLGELGDQSYLLRSVLIDLAQTATITDSLRLGTSILDRLDDVTRLHYTRVEQAPFVVLKSPDIPSVLVETGFISNTREEARLKDNAYQNKIAEAMLIGIQSYLKKYPPGNL
jgi:N-acetylmuramoyl-L-alanine amidase